MILTLALGAALDRCDKPIHLGLFPVPAHAHESLLSTGADGPRVLTSGVTRFASFLEAAVRELLQNPTAQAYRVTTSDVISTHLHAYAPIVMSYAVRINQVLM